jgi:hypothetical protein
MPLKKHISSLRDFGFVDIFFSTNIVSLTGHWGENPPAFCLTGLVRRISPAGGGQRGWNIFIAVGVFIVKLMEISFFLNNRIREEWVERELLATKGAFEK